MTVDEAASNDNEANLVEAIATLGTVVRTVERNMASIDRRLADIRTERQSRLDRRVAGLLSGISNSTLKTLRREVPAFAADASIEKTFADHGRIFWFLRRPGYAAALTLLQARLKSYLEQNGLVRGEDGTIIRLESERATAAAVHAEAMEKLNRLQDAYASGHPLSPEEDSATAALAAMGRTLDRGGGPINPVVRPRPPKGKAAPTSDGDNISSGLLWLWLMSGNSNANIATSTSGTTADPFTGRGGTFGGAGASAAWSPDPEQDRAAALMSNVASGPDAGGAGLTTTQILATLAEISGDPVTAAKEARAPIATDDRLGAFS